VTDAASRCLDFVLRHEGGYVHVLSDPGGETNYGISKRAFPTLDIRALTREAAKLIYFAQYWQPIHGDTLPEPLALCLVDFAVNSGVARALVFLAEVTGSAGVELDIKARGLRVVCEDLICRRALFLVHLGCTRGGSEQFLVGWMRRIVDNLRAVRAMDGAQGSG